MVRFFVDGRVLDQERICLSEEHAAHARVLRLKLDEQVLLCDGAGSEVLCRVFSTEGGAYILEKLERRTSQTEPLVKATVYMALPKADKLEHVIQKATELGVYEIVTFPTARCVSRPDEKSLQKKLERWRKIASSAAEQSGRGRVPQVRILGDYATALKEAAQSDLAIVFYENERASTLRQALSVGAYQSVSLLSGPEGGFETWEIQQAREAGFRICTLGTRILRCETAPLCALSAVMYDSGEF